MRCRVSGGIRGGSGVGGVRGCRGHWGSAGGVKVSGV